MTTPTERRRALRWMAETLQDLGADPLAPEKIKREAEELLAAWPGQSDVASCFLEMPEEKLGGVLEAICRGQELLEQASCCRSLDPKTKRAVQATARHFPQAWELPAGREKPLLPRAWIDLYLLRDVDHADLAREIESIRAEGSG